MDAKRVIYDGYRRYYKNTIIYYYIIIIIIITVYTPQWVIPKSSIFTFRTKKPYPSGSAFNKTEDWPLLTKDGQLIDLEQAQQTFTLQFLFFGHISTPGSPPCLYLSYLF